MAGEETPTTDWNCPKCNGPLQVANEHLGKMVRCPHCREVIQSPILATLWEPPAATDAQAETSVACPYCGLALVPRPKRGRACAACGQKFVVRNFTPLTVADADKHDEEIARQSLGEHWQAVRSIPHRMRYFREVNNASLKDAKEMADVFPWLKISGVCDGNSCEFCIQQNGRFLRTRETTQKMIPPFSCCTSKERGCRCTIIPISKYDLEEHGLPAE